MSVKPHQPNPQTFETGAAMTDLTHRGLERRTASHARRSQRMALASLSARVEAAARTQGKCVRRELFWRVAPRIQGWAARSPAKLGALAVAALVFVWLAQSLPWGPPSLDHMLPWPTMGSALRLYWRAALDLRAGHSPYVAGINWIHAHSATDWRNIYGMENYNYPPLLAQLFIPLTALPLAAVTVGWELLSLGCALYVAGWLAWLIFPRARGIDRLVVVLVALDLTLLFGPLRHSLKGAQVDIMLIALLIGSWNALRAERRVVSGVLLAAIIAVKPTYLLLLGFHLWRREWRAGAVALVAGVLGVVVPFMLAPHQALIDYQRIDAFYNAPGFIMAPKSISIIGVLQRICFVFPPLWRLYTAPFVATATNALIGLGTYLGASRLIPANATKAGAGWNRAFGLIILVMLLGSPLTEDAHLSLLLIPLGVVVAAIAERLRQGDQRAWWLLALVGLFYVYFTLPVRGIASYSTYDGWRAVFSGYWFYGLAGVTVLYIWQLRQAAHCPPESSALTYGWKRLSSVAGRARARWTVA